MRKISFIPRAHIFRFCHIMSMAVCVLVLCCIAYVLFRHYRATVSMQATPWACVGGCGAGGSGGAAGATAKWIGRGVSGGLLDVQLMCSSTATKKSISNGLEAKLSMKPTYTSTLSLTVPFLSKTGSMQVSTASDEVTGIVNNGLGDIRFDFINTFGMSGQFSYNFTLSLPTGDYAASTGANNKKNYLPTVLQLGSGLCCLSLDMGYTRDFDKAMLLIDATYSHPFAVNLHGKNQFISPENDKFNSLDDPAVWKSLSDEQKHRFEYYFKPYGENDLGGYVPPGILLSAFWAYTGMQKFVHSVGLMFYAPFGVTWIPNYDCKSYNPRPDPDHQAWNATLCYGLEFSRTNFPIFIAAYLPIHDKSAVVMESIGADEFDERPMADWNGPDWKDIFRRWSVFVGTKSTFF